MGRVLMKTTITDPEKIQNELLEKARVCVIQETTRFKEDKLNADAQEVSALFQEAISYLRKNGEHAIKIDQSYMAIQEMNIKINALITMMRNYGIQVLIGMNKDGSMLISMKGIITAS